MAPSTRSKPAHGKKKDEPATAKAATRKLGASVPDPPQLFILPKDASPAARITTIPNPASAAPNRYFVCPDKGFYEFTRIAAAQRQQRSWLLVPDRSDSGQEEGAGLDSNGGEVEKDMGYVLKSPDMFVATPVDPLFLLLPSLAGDVASIGQEYLAPSDYWARLGESSTHFAHMLQSDTTGKLERILEHRIVAVCDCMDMGDDKMYALSLPKLVKELVYKAKRMTAQGLPESMEDRFVKQALRVPVLSIKREESSISIATLDAETVAEGDTSRAVQSQESDASGTSVATVSTTATSISVTSAKESQTAPNEVVQLLRLRVALDFILASCISSTINTKLQPLILDANTSGIDFASLDKHLEDITQLKKEAQALRSLSDNISRKRTAMDDDDEAIDKAQAKKRKKEEEENRKKNVSQGVKKLMKADTSGMNKLSSFFTKPTTKK